MSYHLLIADDSDTVRSVIVKTLGLAGFRDLYIHQAKDGQQALDILREHWIDLVLADINMPTMTGLEMFEKMKADNTLSDIPVLVISTEGSRTRIDDLKQRGISGFVRKPFTPESLKLAVESALNAKGFH